MATQYEMREFEEHARLRVNIAWNKGFLRGFFAAVFLFLFLDFIGFDDFLAWRKSQKVLNTHTNDFKKARALISTLKNKLPYYISSMFENISLTEYPIYPNTVKYKNTIRFALPTYLNTAPDILLEKAKSVSFSCFKFNIKSYILERYSSLCTTLGCGACHRKLHI